MKLIGSNITFIFICFKSTYWIMLDKASCCNDLIQLTVKAALVALINMLCWLFDN